MPQKYHCRPQILDLGFIKRQYCLTAIISKIVYIYIFDYQSRDIDDVFIYTVSKYFTMKSIQ